jgi:hypothetical protein
VDNWCVCVTARATRFRRFRHKTTGQPDEWPANWTEYQYLSF